MAQKPIKLLLELLEDHTDPGDVVLDLFGGSGTTGSAAIRIGRRAIVVEKDERSWTDIVDRMRAEETGSTFASLRAGQVTLFT